MSALAPRAAGATRAAMVASRIWPARTIASRQPCAHCCTGNGPGPAASRELQKARARGALHQNRRREGAAASCGQSARHGLVRCAQPASIDADRGERARPALILLESKLWEGRRLRGSASPRGGAMATALQTRSRTTLLLNLASILEKADEQASAAGGLAQCTGCTRPDHGWPPCREPCWLQPSTNGRRSCRRCTCSSCAP